MTAAKSTHKCPPWCHRCPLCIGPRGEACIMPQCWGSIHRNDLFGCCCDLPGLKRKSKMRAKIKDLERRLAEVEAKLCERTPQ